MKKSWSLSCFGILGKRGKAFKGKVEASVTVKRVKKHIKRLSNKNRRKKENVATISKNDGG